ncbi:MAG: hypothetical protein ACK5OA_06635 [Acidovorax sp.]
MELGRLTWRGEKFFDGTQKAVLQYKASLIAAKQEIKAGCKLGLIWFFKNIQPISVGV